MNNAAVRSLLALLAVGVIRRMGTAQAGGRPAAVTAGFFPCSGLAEAI